MLRAVILASVLVAATARAEEPLLRENDRVVFYGDSITAQRLYTTFVETAVATRLPSRSVRFVHSGWGGDTVRGGGGGPIEKRLARDVTAYKPTVVTIMLGMNDASYRGFDAKIFDAFETGYEKIVATLKKELPGVRLVLIEPSAYDEVTRPATVPGGYNATLVRFGAFVRGLAAREGARSVDLNAPLVACLEKANAANHELAQKIVPDRVHPAPAGHLIMAAALLRGLGVPSVVSEVSIDFASRTAKTKNAEVAEIGSLSWTEKEAALPLPLDAKDPAIALALASSSVGDDADRELLRATGLEAGRYLLKIDDEKVAVFSSVELERGVNLALEATPMLRAAHAVHALTRKHADLHDTRWKLAVANEGSTSAHLAKALEELDAFEEDVLAERREAAKPVLHRFRLVRVE